MVSTEKHTHFILMAWLNGTSEINRNNLLEYKEKNNNKRVPLVLTYHPSLDKISGIVRHHWKEIEKSETLAKTLKTVLRMTTTG
jgi:hypothetical protein